MRIAIAAVLGLFVAANLAGCGGATIPTPPSNAQAGPPPGTSSEWTKVSKNPGGQGVMQGGLPGAYPATNTPRK
jgi:hypothetical protein